MGTEYGHAAGSAYVYFAIGHHWRDELVVAEVVFASGGLTGVVEFVG